MIKVNRSKHTWEEFNKIILGILDQIAEEKQAKKKNEIKLYIVCLKLSRTVRVTLQAGSQQDDHNMLWYFRLGTDLDEHSVDFNFYTADIATIFQQAQNEYFILLSCWKTFPTASAVFYFV